MELIPYGHGRSIPHVTEKIFRLLNKRTLVECRKVNSTWKNYLENPSFWFQKFGWMKIGIPNDDNHDMAKHWRGLAQEVEKHGNKTVAQFFVLPLIKMVDEFYKKHPLEIVVDLEESKSLKKPANYQVLVDFILEHLDPYTNCEAYGYPDIEEFTPIQLAAMYGKIKVVKNLVRKYESPNAGNNLGVSPIILAAGVGHMDIVKFLVDYTDTPLAPDIFGKNPIHAAARNSNLEIVKFLANYTDSPNAPTNDGRTPIHAAAQGGDLEIVKFLVNYTDRPNSPDNIGRTPIHAAARSDNLEVIKFLVAYTDSPNAPDNFGQTTIMLTRNPKVAQFLEEFVNNTNMVREFGHLELDDLF